MAKYPKMCKWHVAFQMATHNSGARFHYDETKEHPIGFNNIYKRDEPITWVWDSLKPCGVCFDCQLVPSKAEFKRRSRFILLACFDHMTLVRIAPMVKNPEIDNP